MENFAMIGAFVLLGMLFRRTGFFPKDSAQVLNIFALYVSLPAVILLKVPQIVFSPEIAIAAALPWGLLAFSASLVLLAARLWNWERPVTGVLLLVVPLGNTSFLGIPMVQAFFGPAGLPYLIIYDQIGTMVIMATYGSFILAAYGKNGALNLSAVARKALLFPPTLALIVGLACRFCPYPKILVQCLESVATTLVPVVMTAIGLQLRFRLPATVVAPLGFGLGIKLLIAPLAALLVCRLAGISGMVVDVSILEAAMPPMVTAGALAVVAGMDPDLAVALIGIGIIVSFATLPAIFWLSRLAA
ncbi:membrane transport protein, putative [Citrifermentans bemidjiense Bem]|uniref:Membrane transport protein, putative n=1 Tax=Citrifermentans bemidjiense (strain ATCC BAA-1014 / DSM 16622 / JCM 12645 / Bem) TaxID=404380 RepID=B5EIP1_CITBB|nr:AEC family transporter [Citrifermentans bemidjiense]ACH38406.1 membrane transport protein, putative [Citrifermentans bemidjiense Bem]